MADSTILTQREIDSLLKSVPAEAPEVPAAGAAPAEPSPVAPSVADLGKSVKQYDFRRPDKFSKEQLRTLQSVHETFARQAAATLSRQLRSNVEIKVSSIDQGLYEEYMTQVGSPSFVHVLRMAPLDGSIVLEFGRDLGFMVVDRLLGGSGALLDQSHEVTDVELQLLRSVGGLLAEDVGEAWENLSAVQPTVTEIHQDIQLASLAPPTEVVIQVFLEVMVLDLVASLSLCTPFSVLEPVLSRLSAEVWVGTGSRMRSTEASRRDLRTQVERTPTRIRATLGSTRVRTADLARLEVGDVIRLDELASGLIAINVGKIRKWYGRPGVISGHIVVELERWAAEEMPPVMKSDDEEQEIESAAPTAPALIELPVMTTTEESEAGRAA